jgi:polyisoprenoid-binding protein YceI
MDENETETLCYRLDTSRSRFTVRAFATGLLSAFAHNPTIAIRDFAGEVQFPPGKLQEGRLRISIKADSLEVVGNVSDKDRREIERQMREEVLETARYPEVVFESTRISAEMITEGQYRVRINGRLFLHGVTGDCEIAARVLVAEDMLRANGEFPLRQTDYSIKPVSALGGTIKLKDELRFSFDIVAQRERK